MGLTIRHYLVGEGSSLSRVPRRVAEALPFGTDAIPAYAGTRQRVADVLIENEDRRPVRSESRLVAKTAAIAHEKRSTREAAVEAGRRLMAQKAEWLGPDISLEVTIYSALEWSPGEE